ncbi:hypothetical protein D3C80_1755940 [compost metagenome]
MLSEIVDGKLAGNMLSEHHSRRRLGAKLRAGYINTLAAQRLQNDLTEWIVSQSAKPAYRGAKPCKSDCYITFRSAKGLLQRSSALDGFMPLWHKQSHRFAKRYNLR